MSEEEELTLFSELIGLLANTSNPVEVFVLFSFIDDDVNQY